MGKRQTTFLELKSAKAALLLMALFFMFAPFHRINAQVTLSKGNTTLGAVIKQIQKQTDYKFFYNDDIAGISVDGVDVKNVSVNHALDQLLAGKGISYTVDKKVVYLKKNTAQAPVKKGEKRKISGKVLDENGDPMIGAVVTVKGTNDRSITDYDGNYVLSTDVVDPTLEYSYVGYKTKELAASKGTSIAMDPDSNVLNEVVVTAMGIKKEAKALSYNVQQVNANEITAVKDANFMNSLAGKVAGVEINTSAAGIGGGVKVVMRGNKSINGNNNALYVIDGIPMPSLTANQPTDAYHGDAQTGDAASMVNPDDIENISVLSGAAASALYGTDAANGVIMITTKKGAVGKPRLSFSNNTSFYSPFVTPEFQNTYGQTRNGSFSSWGSKLETPSSYDPLDFFQTGYMTANSLTFSTGSDKSQTFASAAYTSAEGIVENNTMSRYNFSIRNTTSFLNDKLHLDLSAMYMKVTEKNMISQGLYFNPIVPIYMFPPGDDIRKYMPYEQYDPERNFKTMYWPYGNQGLSMMNPYWETNRTDAINHKDRFVLSAGLTWNIIKGISLAGRAKIDKTNGLYEKKYSASTDALFAGEYGAYYRTDDNTRQIYADAIVNVDKYFGDFSLNANVGTSIKDVDASNTYNGGFLNTIANSFTLNNVNRSTAHLDQDPSLNYHHQVQSIFATAQVGWRSMLYADITARNDWDSFLGNTKYKSNGFFYPSVGVSAILTEMIPAIKNDVLTFLKLRASYSEVGNTPEKYYALLRYEYANATPASSSYFPNTDLQPERTKAWELGLQANLWNDKINLNVSLYSTQTTNQFFLSDLSAGSGYLKAPVNGGRIDNKGIEMSLGFNQNLGPVKWNTNITYTLNRNKIKKLLAAGSLTSAYGETVDFSAIDALDMMNLGPVKVRLTEGGSMGDLYVTVPKVDEHGYIIVDYTSRNISGQEDGKYVYAGNTNPKYRLGWRNNFEWNGISLGFLINARVGGVVSSITQGYMDYFGVSKATADARDEGGALVNGVRIPAQDFYQKVGPSMGYNYIYSATNVRLAELTLGYDVPVQKWVPWVQNLHVAFTGRNLLMFYCKAPFDPELTASTGTYFSGIDNFMMPSLRSLGFSVKVDF